MRRRLTSLLLTVLVAVTGIAVGACPLGRCLATQPAVAAEPEPEAGCARHQASAAAHAGHAMHDGHAVTQHAHAGHHATAETAAGSHACCDRDGITNLSCCPETGQLAQQRATTSSERVSDALQLAAAQPVATVLALPSSPSTDPPRQVPPGAPPGTLIAQHTSLLV